MSGRAKRTASTGRYFWREQRRNGIMRSCRRNRYLLRVRRCGGGELSPAARVRLTTHATTPRSLAALQKIIPKTTHHRGLGSFHVDYVPLFPFFDPQERKRARLQSVDTLTSLAPKQFSFRVCQHCSGCEVSLTVPSMDTFHSNSKSIPRYTIYDVERWQWSRGPSQSDLTAMR